MSYILDAFAFLFIQLLDTVVYSLIAVAYNIFYAVAQINLFGGNTAGQALYDTITGRLYNVLSIVVIFIFAYQLIMMIIDPDGKEQKSSGTLVKDTLISIMAIILLPTLFKYMATFQNHILENHTIEAIVLGNNGISSDIDSGKTLSLMLYVSMYHPNNTTYSTFFDENGKLLVNGSITSSEAYDNCLVESGNRTSACEKYIEGLQNWENSPTHSIAALTSIGDLRHWIGDTMEYIWILTTAVGVFISWTLFAYSIALGTRAVKLGVLQLIAPVALIFRIFPQTRKTYETWFGEIKKAFVELFARVFIYSFAAVPIPLVPIFIDIIFPANDYAGSGLIKCIATVCLLLGILQFIKDAPDLFKTLFSNGGNLFSGLNFSPKIRSHVESNPYAMKAIGMGTGMIGGAVGSVVKRFKESYDAGGGRITGTSSRVRSAVVSLSALPRGLISGGRSGYKNAPTKLTRKDIAQNTVGGVEAAHSSLENRAFGDTRANVRDTLHALNDPNNTQTVGQNIKDFVKRQGDITNEWASEEHAKNEQKRENFINTLTGNRRDYTRATTAAQTIADGASGIIDTASGIKELDTRKNNIRTKADNGEITIGEDGKKYQKMFNKENDIVSRSNIIDTKTLADGSKQIVTNDGFKYIVDTKGDVISRTRNIAEAVAIQAKKAAANGQTISVDGKNYSAKLSDDVKTIMNNVQTVSATTTSSSGETIREITTKSGSKYIETTATDGSKTLKSTDGKVTYNVASDGTVQSKEQKVTINGVSETRVTENVQNLIVAKQAEAAANTSETIYNVETIYKEINNEKSSKVTKTLKDNAEARKTYAKTMLAAIRDNAGSFSANYSADVQKEFFDKFGNSETIADFLKRMSDDRTTANDIKDDDGKKIEAIKKIMNNEINRSKANADAEKKAREAAEAAKPKKDDKKS